MIVFSMNNAGKIGYPRMNYTPISDQLQKSSKNG
jgi:hypothetical protein